MKIHKFINQLWLDIPKDENPAFPDFYSDGKIQGCIMIFKGNYGGISNGGMVVALVEPDQDITKIGVFWNIDRAYVYAHIFADKEPIKVDYDSMTIPHLADCLKSMKRQLDEAAEAKTYIQKKYDYLSIEVIPDRMDEEDIKSLTIKGLGRMQLKSDIRCNVLAANKEAVQNWLTDNGHASMINPTINSGTFKAFIKERMKDGKDWPEDLVNVSPYSRASVVKI